MVVVAEVAGAGAVGPLVVVVAAVPLLEVPDPEPVLDVPAPGASAPGGAGHPAGGFLPPGGGGQFAESAVAVGFTTAVGASVGGSAVGVAGTTRAVAVAGATTAVSCGMGVGSTTAT